jgi:transcriptional regulator with XRE-family HTH domain
MKLEHERFAQRLVEAMAKAGITQTELAHRAKIDRGQINLYCNAKVRPRGSALARIAAVLGVEIADLAGANGAESTKATASYLGGGRVLLRVECETTMDVASQIMKLLDG